LIHTGDIPKHPNPLQGDDNPRQPGSQGSHELQTKGDHQDILGLHGEAYARGKIAWVNDLLYRLRVREAEHLLHADQDQVLMNWTLIYSEDSNHHREEL